MLSSIDDGVNRGERDPTCRFKVLQAYGFGAEQLSTSRLPSFGMAAAGRMLPTEQAGVRASLASAQRDSMSISTGGTKPKGASGANAFGNVADARRTL
jgi:hypothetical protein